MSWVTVIWSMNAAVCLTLAAINFIVWLKAGKQRGHLLFSIAAILVATISWLELQGMHAGSIVEYCNLLRWAHVPFGVLIICIVWFARIRLNAGRSWLAWAITGMRVALWIPDFLATYNVNYRQVTGLGHTDFLGEKITYVEGLLNPWMILGQLGLLAVVVFLVDVSLTVWRRGEKPQALFLGGALLFFALFSWTNIILTLATATHVPFMVSFSFTGLILFMAYELSRDVLRATHLLDQLRESEQRLGMAAEAAKLGIWVRDLVKNEVWASENWRKLFGYTPMESLAFEDILERMHPEDRAMVNQAFANALTNGGHYETEYRLILPGGQTRWIASRGRIESNGNGNPKLLRGVSVDITDRKHAELEVAKQRNEVAHLSRVTMLGEISGSLAHELNQPLGAILSNTEAAEMHLQQKVPNLDEVRAILADIRRDDIRAGEIIHGMRAFLRRRALQMEVMEITQLVKETVTLISADAATRKTRVALELGSDSMVVAGDRIHLQQVLINLLVNGMDAMSSYPVADRCVTIRSTRPDPKMVEIAVSDAGVGIPKGNLTAVFEPFHTTKQAGLGLGLSICRSIVEAHGGTISVENNPDCGATARFRLPVIQERAFNE